MTRIVVTDQSERVLELCRLYLREPVNEGDPGAERTLVFDPDLTPEETALFDVLQRIAASEHWTPDAYSAVRAEMQTLRDLRQMGRNAFMALSAAERDRLTYDALVAQTIIDLAILRD
jgi:hypothetical protein